MPPSFCYYSEQDGTTPNPLPPIQNNGDGNYILPHQKVNRLSDTCSEYQLDEHAASRTHQMLRSSQPAHQNAEMQPRPPQARKELLTRYYEKGKRRLHGDEIRYPARKARAEARKRVKGRFVREREC